MKASLAPKVVALGGGHGLATTLEALRLYAGHITAVVSTADNGGSSGKLRKILSMPAPGDIRRCLVALSDASSLWKETFEYRFETGELEGHALGNLLIAGMTCVTQDFIVALKEVSQLLHTAGDVFPATITPVSLKATLAEGFVEGQIAIAGASNIKNIFLVPADPKAPKEVIQAIQQADQVVIGPGSLYTSILATTIVPQISQALKETKAHIIYVCNLRPQSPETEGYDVASHVSALLSHGIEPDVVLCDSKALSFGEVSVPLVHNNIARENAEGHDVVGLAKVLQDLVK